MERSKLQVIIDNFKMKAGLWHLIILKPVLEFFRKIMAIAGICLLVSNTSFAAVLPLDRHVFKIGETLTARWEGMASLNNGVMLDVGKNQIMYFNTALPSVGSQDLTFYSDWNEGIFYFMVESKANTSFNSVSEAFYVGFPVSTPSLTSPKTGAVFFMNDPIPVSFSGSPSSVNDVFLITIYKGSNTRGTVVFDEEASGTSMPVSTNGLEPGSYYIAVRATKTFPEGFGISQSEFKNVFQDKVSGSVITIKINGQQDQEETETDNDSTEINPGDNNQGDTVQSLPFSENFDQDSCSMSLVSIGKSSKFSIAPQKGVDGSACAKVTKIGTSTSTPLWQEYLALSGIDMASFQMKALEFDIRGDSSNVGRSIEVITERGTSPYDFQGLWGEVVLTASYQHVRFDFIPSFIDFAEDTILKLRYGGVPGNIYFDNFVLKNADDGASNDPGNQGSDSDDDGTGTDVADDDTEEQETTTTTPLIDELKKEAGCFINTIF